MSDIIIFDLEATGKEYTTAKIVSIAAMKMTETGEEIWYDGLFNPGIYMDDDVIAIHGITNDDVIFEDPFEAHAEEILRFFEGCNLAGFNLKNYDIPLLWEELYRAGFEWDLTDVKVIDVGNIFKKKEPRTLSAALKFYCDKVHESAHQARSDVVATAEVLAAQRERYPDIKDMSIDELHEYSRLEKMERVDLAGKVLRNDEGEYVFGMRGKEHIRIIDDIGLAEWILKKDFSENTKKVIRKIIYPQMNIFDNEA